MARADRRLIVPEEAMATASLIRAEATTDESDQQKGLVARPPEVDSTDAPSGDIRPVLGGVPEVYSKGKVALTHSGVVDTARFGWVRDGDTEATDLQLRQSPMVVGRVPALLDRNTSMAAGNIGLHNRPRLLALANGDALLLWIDAIRAPIFAQQGQDGRIKIATLSADGTWGAAANVIGSTVYTVTPDVGGKIIAADFAQYPDTGEIVMVVGVQETSTGSPTDRRIYAFHSDDDGTTWVERARYFLAGSPPDLLDLDGDGTTDDASPIVDLAVERADSGRLVCMLRTEDGLWSLTSDTRGSTWKTAVRVEDASSPADEVVGRSVGMTRLRNGLLAVIAGSPASTDNGFVVLTPNGEDFSTRADVIDALLGTDVAIVTRPDGFPMIFGTMHIDWTDQAVLGWLWARSATVRDPGMDTTIADWRTETAATPVESIRAFHLTESLGGAFTDGTPNLHLGGFTGIDVIEWRGQLLMATVVVRQDTGTAGTDPGTLESSLMVYRLNHWQPCQERLSNVYDSGGPTYYPANPGIGRVYNRTWDCYTDPTNAGFAAGGAPVSTLVAGGADDGYFEITNPGGGSLGKYQDTTLPNPSSGFDAVCRAIVKVPDSGDGDTTLDEIILGLQLRDGGGLGRRITVRFENTGVTQKVAVYDNGAAALIGSTGDYALGAYIEILFSMDVFTGTDVRLTLLAREHVQSTDPDFDNPYDLLVDDVTLTSMGSVAGELLVFGHDTTTDVTSRWKGVHLHRAQELNVRPPLVQLGSTYTDEDTENDRSAAGGAEGRFDSGVDNFMRTSQVTATPAQYVERRLEASFRGEALTEGLFDYETGYRFPAANLFALPGLAEWRSMEDSKQIGLVFDADPDSLGYRWRPEAVAVFGRNFPAMTLQMHTADSWGTPDFERTFGNWYSGHGFDRTTTIWAIDLAAQSYFYEKRRVSIYDGFASPLSASALWREHQFRSTEGSTRYYLVGQPSVGSPRVWEIEDNTADTLILREEPDRASMENTLNTFDLKLAIYSSTFAAPLDLAYDSSFTDSGTTYLNTHPKGFRYLRVLIPGFQLNVGVSNGSADDFARLGYLMLGRSVELSGPDPSWGWTKGVASGVELGYGRRGASSVVRSSAPRRSVQFDYLAARPPPEPTAEYNSPRAPSLDSSRASWDRWWSIVRRLEIEGTPVALVWEADRMHEVTTGDGGSMVPRTPEEVLLARVTSPGQFTHVAYECLDFDQTTVDGDTTVIRPIAATRGIVFTEEL